MNLDLNDFEHQTRIGLLAELARVPSPRARPTRIRPRQADGKAWLVGTTAIGALIAISSVKVISPTGQTGVGSIRLPTASSAPAFSLPPARSVSLTGMPPIKDFKDPSGEVARIWQGNRLLAVDRIGTATLSVDYDLYASILSGVERAGKRTLMLVALDDGAAGLLDQDSMVLTRLDVRADTLEPRLVLSPDWTQVVFKTRLPGTGEAALIQVDVATSATWTLIASSTLAEHASWLTDGSVYGWGHEGIYLDVQTPVDRRVLRISPRANDPAAPQPAFESLLWMERGGEVQVNAATALISYRPHGDPQRYMLDTRTDQVHPMDATNVAAITVDPGGKRVASLQDLGGDTYTLLVQDRSEKFNRLATLTKEQAFNVSLRWSVDGRYLSLVSTTPPSEIRVFDTWANIHNRDQPFPLVAKYVLPGAITSLMVHHGEGKHVRAVSVGVDAGRYELTIYDTYTRTRQAYDLGSERAVLIYVP